MKIINPAIKKVESKILAWIDLFEQDVNREPWQNVLIECFQFTLDKSDELQTSHIQDIYETLSLLHSAFIEKTEYAYIILKNRFRPYSSPEQMGNALRAISQRLREFYKIESENENDWVSFTKENGAYKSCEEILNELAEKWSEVNI